jgi:hypothetical protein
MSNSVASTLLEIIRVQALIGAAPHIYIFDWKGRLSTFAPCWWLKEIHPFVLTFDCGHEYLHPRVHTLPVVEKNTPSPPHGLPRKWILSHCCWWKRTVYTIGTGTFLTHCQNAGKMASAFPPVVNIVSYASAFRYHDQTDNGHCVHCFSI